MGTAFLLLSLQTQMSYTRQIRKEKAATPLLCIQKLGSGAHAAAEPLRALSVLMMMV
jgi:hypothetical protein